MAARVVFVQLELVDSQPGAWCPHCALPSAMTVTLASQIEGRPMFLSTGVRCFDGHGWIS